LLDATGAALAAFGSGAVGATVQRVTIATDSPGVVAQVAHDAADAGLPIKVGGYAKATAPTAVSADADRVNAWFDLRGALAGFLTAGGAIIGGDATNGLDVDVTRIASQGLSASATFTPAAASHVANDVNGAAQEFALGAVSASRIIITSATLYIDNTAAEATAWRLHLYNVTPTSAIADDAAWDFADADVTQYLGYVDLPSTATDLGTNQWAEVNGINKQVKLAGTSVFGYLQNLTTFTPAAAAHLVTLHAVAV